MANVNFPKELLALLEEYLTDHVISERERRVLLKRAFELGIDTEEFDLYIDAQIQKHQKLTDEAMKQQQGRLCPFCNASLPNFTDKCPECGKNVTPEASKEVEELVNSLDKALIDFKVTASDRESGRRRKEYAANKAKVESHIRKAKMYYENNKTIKSLIEEIEGTIADSEKRIASAKRKRTFKNIIASFIGIIILLAIAVFYYIENAKTFESEREKLQMGKQQIESQEADVTAKKVEAVPEVDTMEAIPEVDTMEAVPEVDTVGKIEEEIEKIEEEIEKIEEEIENELKKIEEEFDKLEED